VPPETFPDPHCIERGGTGVSRATRLLLLGVTLLVLAVYLASARGLRLTYDEYVVFDTTAQLSRGKATVAPPRLPSRAVTRPDGKHAGIYGIGTSVVALPLYEAGKAVSHLAPKAQRGNVVVNMTMFTGSVLTATTVFVLMLLCLLLGAPPAGAVLIGLAYGLGSFAYPHTSTLFTEPGTALLVVTAAYFAIRAAARNGRRADLVVCGLSAGTALLFRASAVLFLPLFGVYCIVAGARARDVRRGIEWGAWYTAGAAGPILVLLAVNRWRYGSATNFGYGIDKATRRKYPFVRGLAGQWLSSGKSVFLYAPIVIVVVLGLWWAVRRAPLAMGLLGSIVLVNTLFFARVQFWSGDWAWGPRYLQIVLPCLAAMAAPLTISRAWRWAVGVAGALGLLFSALPAVLLRFTYLFNAAYSVMPPDRPSGGPTNWDHSYYALIWHTRRFQPILWQLRRLPRTISNTIDGSGRMRVELWWLRPSAFGWPSTLCFALLTIGAAGAGVWMLSRSMTARREAAEPPPERGAQDLVPATANEAL
jgi:hypothetical protein